MLHFQGSFLRIALAVSLIASPLAASIGAASPDSTGKKGVATSLTLSQKEAARLLIFSSVLQARVGDIVEISPKVANKYESVRVAVLSPISIGLVGGGTYFTSRQSFDTFKSVITWVTAAVKYVGGIIVRIAHGSWDILEASHIDKALESSGDSLHASYKVVAPVIRLIVTRGSGISLAATSSLGLFGATVFFSSNNPTGAMTYSTARALFGEDRELRAKINSTVRELSFVYSIDEANQAKFTEALYDQIVKQAIATKFDRKAVYHLDVVGIMVSNHLISPDQAIATEVFQKTYEATESNQPQLTQVEQIANNVSIVAALSAELEELALSGRLNNEDQKEVANLLVNSERNLRLIQSNLTR